MSLLLLNLILLGIILFLLVVLSWVWPPDSPWAPWWRTNKKVARAMCKLAKVTQRDTVYDLGCGDGTALLIAVKEFGAKGVGIEIDPLRYWIAKVRAKINCVSDRVIFRRKNFFDEDLDLATVIFVYLVPKTLSRLQIKFQNELQKNTKIVSYRYQMNLPLVDKDKKHQLYLYKV